MTAVGGARSHQGEEEAESPEQPPRLTTPHGWSPPGSPRPRPAEAPSPSSFRPAGDAEGGPRPPAAPPGSGASTGGVPGHGGGRRCRQPPCRPAEGGGGAGRAPVTGRAPAAGRERTPATSRRRRRGSRTAPPGALSPAEAPSAAPSSAAPSSAAPSAVPAARGPASPAGRSAEGLQFAMAEGPAPPPWAGRGEERRAEQSRGAGRLLTLPGASAQVARRHLRPLRRRAPAPSVPLSPRLRLPWRRGDQRAGRLCRSLSLRLAAVFGAPLLPRRPPSDGGAAPLRPA